MKKSKSSKIPLLVLSCMISVICFIFALPLFGLPHVLIPLPVFLGIVASLTYIIYNLLNLYLERTKEAKLQQRELKRQQLELEKRRLELKQAGYELKASTESSPLPVKLHPTIADSLVDKREKNCLILYLILSLSFLLHILACYFSNHTISVSALLFVLLLVLAVFLNQYLLEYRLKKGFYGTNEYEAREYIEFILNHQKKSDFSDGNGLKELFPKPERDNIAETLIPSAK